ncbi:SusE domain-containing protein [Winogradskyella sediminis]|uniref:SusE outer membrane protein n=1 Tax=Winogradskyella sediminis TaxID=1382466 RepID=A0A1H1PA67_9FLAO|nr:SusE domain-containing protein [Winogradskyella sediminis]SDS08188.1 SusE outer membrane protein [Winogradskyella sediminis]
MKKIYKHLLLFAIASMAITGCEKDENMQPEGQWDLIAPTITLPAADQSIILDQETPNETITFSWEPAISTAGYAITYAVVIDTLGSTNFDTPIFEVASSNSGSSTSAVVSFAEIDEALSVSGYTANESTPLTWAVKSMSLSKTAYTSQTIDITRFEDEVIPTRLYISGTATENANNLSEAIQLKRLNNSEGNPSNIHEVYTSLTAGNSFKFYSENTLPAHQYGGSDGELVKSGLPITATENGVYRITVNLDDNTYSLLKIDYWSMVGQPINGGWGGDEPLSYQGNSIWSATIELVDVGGFLFRANGDWSYLLKSIVGVPSSLIMESQAADQGVEFEDIQSTQLGTFLVTLDLSANGYTYTIEEDTSTPPTPLTTPDQLYLFVNGNIIEELAKDGDTFTNSAYLALQVGDVVSINTASDGSGDTFTSTMSIGSTTSPDAALVSEGATLTAGLGDIVVDRDQAYGFILNFANTNFQWKYYNLFLFHWDEINQGWDDRSEFLMTYVHPNSFTLTETLSANYDMKFFSPWDNDFGSESPSELSGTITNGGGSNIRNISTDGTYTITTMISDDYATGTYEFVAQ